VGDDENGPNGPRQKPERDAELVLEGSEALPS
jgi:hypothetical protein